VDTWAVFPSKGILTAARRWIGLLNRSDFAQAAVLIRTNPQFADLTATQYALARDWLLETDVLQSTPGGLRLAPALQDLSPKETAVLLFARSLEASPPTWLRDADELVLKESELPTDAADLAVDLGISETEALLSIRQVFGHIDLAARSEVGKAGEACLVAALEATWPGSTRHVALEHDGLGYDIVVQTNNKNWHLEVKSTTRRGRLTLHLSRQEYEVSRIDPDWRLVALGLDTDLGLACVATVDKAIIDALAPNDEPGGARWESAGYELTPSMLRAGMDFLEAPPAKGDFPWFLKGRPSDPLVFAWMPRA
jgi:hypothetical protein